MGGAGEPDDLGGQTALAGFQDAAVGVSEAGDIEGQKLLERALGLVEAGLELPRGGAEGRHGGVARRGHRPARIAQQRLASGEVVGRDAPGREEGLGLARAQAMAGDGVGQARLLRTRERREGVRGGGREPAVIDVDGQDGREPVAEHQAAIDPAPAMTEQLGDLGRGEVVVVGQRAHHPRLVHRTQRAARRIGLEHPRFAHDPRRVLDHDGHVRVPVASPLRQALEPIEDLVGADVGRGDPQGQRRERAPALGPRAAQRRQRGGEPLDRQVEYDAHRGFSRGRSW